MPSTRPNSHALALNVSAYLLWASAALLFKQLEHLPAWLVLAQRILWSLLFCGLILLLYRGRAALAELASLVHTPRQLAWLPLSSLLIASNWLMVIWAVGAGRLQDASLGYYLAPALSLLLAKRLFHEPWRTGEPLCLGLCVLGAGLVALAGGLQQVPWIGLLIALTFALYSALKKAVSMPPLAGLSLETAVAAIPAALYLLIQREQSAALSSSDLQWLVAIGLVTTLPMLFYVISLRHLPLTIVGNLQYLNPSLMFLLAVLVFQENLNALKLAGFSLIWAALLYQLLKPTPPEAAVSPAKKLSHPEH